MKKRVCLLAVLIVAGCQSHKQQPLTVKQQQELPTISRWAFDFKEAVEQRLPSVSKFAGKICTIRVHQPKGTKKISSMYAVEGDPGLCDVAIKAIQAASDDGVLPLTPDAIGEEFPLDFKI